MCVCFCMHVCIIELTHTHTSTRVHKQQRHEPWRPQSFVHSWANNTLCVQTAAPPPSYFPPLTHPHPPLKPNLCRRGLGKTYNCAGSKHHSPGSRKFFLFVMPPHFVDVSLQCGQMSNQHWTTAASSRLLSHKLSSFSHQTPPPSRLLYHELSSFSHQTPPSSVWLKAKDRVWGLTRNSGLDPLEETKERQVSQDDCLRIIVSGSLSQDYCLRIIVSGLLSQDYCLRIIVSGSLSQD
jgi:hypothetical protein